MSDTYGVEWVKVPFSGNEPRWTVEPDVTVIATIIRDNLHLRPTETCIISFLAEGSFNKIYKVTTDRGTFAMRVALPLDVPCKVMSEVATANFILQVVSRSEQIHRAESDTLQTDIPTPKIIAFDPSNTNKLRFPWILMEFVHGQTLGSCWRHITIEKKEKLVRQLARYQAQLWDNPLNSIGSLRYRSEDGSPRRGVSLIIGGFILILFVPTIACFLIIWLLVVSIKPSTRSIQVGRMVALDLLHADEDIIRGPYTSTHEWLQELISST